MIVINTNAMHLRIDREAALGLFKDMERSGITDVHSHPTTDALYQSLLSALRESERPRVPELLWGPGKWSRTSSGAYVWRKRIVLAREPAKVGPTLARVERLESGLWKPWVFPCGDSNGGRPVDVVDWIRPTRTLWESKDAAQAGFIARRKVIEQG